MNLAIPRLEGIVLYKRHIAGVACEPVTEFNDALRSDVEAAKQIMFKMDGVGISAPQVGIFQRFSICNVGSQNLVMVNPLVDVVHDEKTVELERCLSIPGAKAKVKRAKHIRVLFQDLDGRDHQADYEDFEARVVLHEVDHLDGIFFLDHVSLLVREIQFAKMHKVLKKGLLSA